MSKKARGFTLIELLVVVSILAAIAGMTSVALGGYQQRAEEQLTRVEMQRIANAIRRFKEDTGYWPKTGPFDYVNNQGSGKTGAKEPTDWDNYIAHVVADPANFSFLFTSPIKHIRGWNITDTSANWGPPPFKEIREWDIDYAIGWHGPYIDHNAQKMIIKDTINPGRGQKCKGLNLTTLRAISEKAQASYPDILTQQMLGLVDRFQRTYKQKLATRFYGLEVQYCHVTKVNIGDINSDGKDDYDYPQVEYSGSPYLYRTNYLPNRSCPGTTSCIVLQSFGKNGIDESDESGLTAKQKEKIDDIVFVLQVNES